MANGIQSGKELLYSKKIEISRKGNAVAAENSYLGYSEEMKNKGDTIKVVTLGQVDLMDYNGQNINFDNIDDAAVNVRLTEQKYFAKKIDRADRVKTDIDYETALLEEAGRSIAVDTDRFIYKSIYNNLKKSTSNIIDAEGATSKNIFDYILNAQTLLNMADAPTDKRVLEVSPLMFEKIQKMLVTTDTNNSEILRKGFCGKLLDFDVYMTNNIYNDGNFDYCIARTTTAYAFALTLKEIERVKPSHLFADAMKGLVVYGGEVIRPKEICVIKFSKGEE
ncbi:MAG: hypothetical protein IKZ35_05335 [Clostridia bacterium]|nr:hypothetical protein [Oscillospiraceae bacterium]MBR4893382.1 hypothetical protein [Clostridia bacterium]